MRHQVLKIPNNLVIHGLQFCELLIFFPFQSVFEQYVIICNQRSLARKVLTFPTLNDREIKLKSSKSQVS